MNSPHHPHHEHHHDVHQQRLLWFFSFCNQRSSSSSNSSSADSTHSHGGASRTRMNRRKTAANRNKFALQYQQQLQQQQRQSSNVFGLDLTEHAQKFSDDDSVPYIVKSCTKFIEKHGIIFGIYRLSGMRVNIHKLRQDFDKNPKISMIDNEAISNDAHAVACVLKQYFRELPTPLLTFHMYEKFIQLFKRNSIDNKQTNNNNNNKNINNSTPTNKCHNNDPQTLVTTNTTSGSNDEENKNKDLAGSVKCTDLDASNDDTDVVIDHDNDIGKEEEEDDLDINCGDSATTLRTKSQAQTTQTKTSTTTTSTSNRNSASQVKVNTSISVDGAAESKTKKSIAQQPLKSKSSIGQQQLQLQHQPLSSGTNVTCARQTVKQHFTTSASDSQLISLSSVVTTTASDVTYQVKLDDLRKLLLQLPHAHYQTLKFLMRHLACIAANGQKTGMDSKNVAIVWAPNLLKPRELELTAGLETLQVIGLQAVITEQLIKHHKFLFDEGENHEDHKRDMVCDVTCDKDRE